jgi:N-acetylneuraminate synthase
MSELSPTRTLVIAEAGVNHNGSIATALALIDAAADSGADVVKFQSFNAAKLVTRHAPKAQYQVSNTGEAGAQIDMLSRLELSREDHLVLIERAAQRGVRFMSTAFDAENLAFLGGLGMPAIKIPSGDITCGPLLLQAARLRQKLIVSTGMCTLRDVENALGVLAFGLTQSSEPRGVADFAAAFASADGQAALREKVTLLHCVTQYPAPAESVNLRAMATMAQAFGLPVGYSDHTLGIEVALAAVALGATVIEKHFTLDRNMRGPDHLASLEPGELARLVSGIRTISLALGSSAKQPATQEIPNLVVARRSLVAARAISRGEIITADMLAAKRPGSGIPPLQHWDLLGTRAVRDFAADEILAT